MTRLDEIERELQMAAPHGMAYISQADALALVAVARAAMQGPCRHDTSHRGETCSLCAALAPLLEETAPRQGNTR